jgi:hypothetical protein
MMIILSFISLATFSYIHASVQELHRFDAASVPGKNFHAAPTSAPAPTRLYTKLTLSKQTKVTIRVGVIFYSDLNFLIYYKVNGKSQKPTAEYTVWSQSRIVLRLRFRLYQK